ncbi:MAG: restriction endonuclease subunit S [Anaerolineales bacterium]|nr:restriction endonuclease subunit S [Anaerolineales bacterium]
MQDHWKVVRLDTIARIGTGGTPQRGNARYYAGGEIPWITSSATAAPFITQAAEFITPAALTETNCRLYPPHTLIVALYGEGRTRGQVSELLIEAATNQACAAIVFDGAAGALRPWVKLYLQANYQRLRSAAGGAAQPNLNLAKIKALQLPLPPPTEQQRILARVEELQRLIGALGAKLEQSAEQRKATYHALLQQFVHADAGAQHAAWHALHDAFAELVVDVDAIGDLRRALFTVACNGQFVTHAHAPGASTPPVPPVETTGHFPRDHRRTSAQLPALPGHWAVVDFGTVAAIQSGYIFKSKTFAVEGIRLLRNINVAPGSINWTDTVRLPWELAEDFARFRLAAGDIVISWTAR